jgi:putative Holliday junction resolvase
MQNEHTQSMPNEGTFLAFDFGLKYIGVAVGQSVTQNARGLTTLKAKQGNPAWHQLAALIKLHKPVGLVVGLPLNMDSSESGMSSRAREFAQQLGKKTKLPITLFDERLTSRQAEAEMAEAKLQGQANTTHELEACYVLEGWFSEN